MPSNDEIILRQLLEERKTERAPAMSEADYFELFTAEQVLKDYDLSYDEIQDGVVGDGCNGFVYGDQPLALTWLPFRHRLLCANFITLSALQAHDSGRLRGLS